MKVLDVHLPHLYEEDLKLENEHIFIIRDAGEHIEGRYELLLTDDIPMPAILSKCAAFTDADYIHFRMTDFNDNRKISDEDFGRFDIISRSIDAGEVKVYVEAFIRTSLLKKAKLDEDFSYLFINELIRRTPDLKCKDIPVECGISLTDEEVILLENESLAIRDALKNSSRKKVIYTFIHTIDQTPKIRMKNIDFDYVCFTDSSIELPSPWIVVQTKFDEATVKACPHYFFKDYCLSIWVDKKSSVIADLSDFISLLSEDEYLLCIDDDRYDCIYDKLKSEKSIELCKFKVKLILEKYPMSNGLIDSYVILRRHNEEECKAMMQEWLYETSLARVKEDFTFNYSLWRKHGRYLSIPFEISNQRFFKKTL